MKKIKWKFFIAEFIFVCYLVFLCSLANAEIIEAEDYAQGGQNVAYYDTSTGNGGNTNLRQDEDVDLWDIGDGIIKIGSVQTNEWVTWQYDYPKKGKYKILLYVSSPNDNATFNLVTNGEQLQSKSPNTGSYRDFTPVEMIFENSIEAGIKTIKITFTGDSLDLDKLDIVLVEEIVEGFGGKYDYVTYVSTTDKQMEIGWDASDGAEWYEVGLYNLEKDVLVNIAEPTTTELTKILNFPYAGHFVARVKACRVAPEGSTDPPEGEDECSEWSLSTNSEVATVDGEPRAWWLYGYLAPPGPIDIGNRFDETINFEARMKKLNKRMDQLLILDKEDFELMKKEEERAYIVESKKPESFTGLNFKEEYNPYPEYDNYYDKNDPEKNVYR